MRTDNYVILNGEPLKSAVSLIDLKAIQQKYSAKVVNTYTFKMRTRLRRVIKLESQGVFYTVYSKPKAIDTNAWSQRPILLTFNKELAYNVIDGVVSEHEAKSVNFARMRQYNIEIETILK